MTLKKPFRLLFYSAFLAIVLNAANVYAFLNPFTAGSFLGNDGLPPPIREYDKTRYNATFNSLYSFNTDEYRRAVAAEEDMRLKDTCFKGPPVEDLTAIDREHDQTNVSEDLAVVPGAQPIGCMPMKVTKRFSPLELSPWYLISLMNPDPSIREPYQSAVGLNEGNAYRGGDNPIRHRQRMVLPTETAQMGCALELMVNPVSGAPDPYDPIWMRRELDNCLNQYILQQARFLRDPDTSVGEYRGFNTGLCQPFRLELPPTKHELYEYMPTEYIGHAWIKLLMDSKYLARNGRSRTEPDYERMSKVKVVKQIPIPADRFGVILVEDLAEKSPINLQFEKILDPSHPYSPRWDFERTDRTYSPLTVTYGGNPRDAVRCSNTVPVDLLKFREKMFDRWVTKKIGFNFFCKNNRFCRWFIWNPLGCTGDAPCCSTSFSQRDKIPSRLRRALCGVPIQDVCNYVARPLTGINTLKLRQNTPENFPQGVPEGYAFSSYFGNHKPYMRCWDSNLECGEKSQTTNVKITGARGSSQQYDFVYNPDSTIGSEYALMGAGREGESCTIGGGLGAGGVGGFNGVDPITSWSELKLYYVRSQRLGVKCIGLEPKIFKPYGTEAFILDRGAVEWQMKVPTAKGALTSYRTLRHNLGWRGYVSDPLTFRRFPNQGGGAAVIRTGLDNAIQGEVLIFDQDVVMSGAPGTWRNPYLAFVTRVNNERSRSAIVNGATAATMDPDQDFVKAIAHNHGKYIDACGNSDDVGMGEEYTMVKAKLFPENERLFSEAGTHTTSCEDPRNSVCIEPLWNNVKRYYIKDNLRN